MISRYKTGICSKCGQLKLIVNKSLKLCAKDDKNRKAKIYAERKKQKVKEGSVVDKAEMAKFLKRYWDTHEPRRCFETDEVLFFYKSYFIHHLLEKHEYPELAYKQDNIVYLSHLKHAEWHSSTEEEKKIKLPKTYKRYEQIRKKYLGTEN